LSSRRVKKGPGRRPQSAKRQLKELRERGWSILAAAREVGVSRTTGNNWSRGYKTYRRGQIVGFVSAPERLALRQISPRFLSQDERIEIADLRHAGLSIRQIAHRLGRAPSTVSRELHRNATKNGGYRPFDAHRRASGRIRNHRRRLEANGELRRLVAELLIRRWSPQQISCHLRLKFPKQSGMWLCHEGIYQAVYQPGSGLLRPSRLAPHHRSPLCTGRDHRRAHQRTERRRATHRTADRRSGKVDGPTGHFLTSCLSLTNWTVSRQSGAVPRLTAIASDNECVVAGIASVRSTAPHQVHHPRFQCVVQGVAVSLRKV
jgi:transposase, IS30 family